MVVPGATLTQGNVPLPVYVYLVCEGVRLVSPSQPQVVKASTASPSQVYDALDCFKGCVRWERRVYNVVVMLSNVMVVLSSDDGVES